MKLLGRSSVVRIRRAAKWAGLVACVLIASAWLASMRWTFVRAYIDPVGMVTIARAGSGCVSFSQLYLTGQTLPSQATMQWGIRVRPRGDPVVWLPGLDRRFASLGGFHIMIPLWIPLLLTAAPTAWLWYRDRRSRPGHCACGYDLAGLAPGSPCPECGGTSSPEGATGM